METLPKTIQQTFPKDVYVTINKTNQMIRGGKSMKKKLAVLGLAATMMMSLFAGCGGKGSSGGKDASADKGSVYYLNFKPEADAQWQELAKIYEEETGVKVTVVTAASGQYETTLKSEMGKSECPTLFQVNGPVGLASWKDYCADLSDTEVYKQLTSEDFALKDGDKVAGIGYVIESYGIICNKKLLAEAGYSMDDIKNFADLKKVAEDITARRDELGFDAFTSSGLDDASAWRFTGHLANMPLFYEGRDDGWKEAPAEIKGTYLENFKNVWDLYINNSKYKKNTLATGGYDAEAEFKKGEAVFYQNGTWEYDALKKSISDDDMQMIPIYCGVEGEEKAGLCSGTENCWAVNAKASEADQKATLDFMKWLVTSKEGTKVMAEQFGAIPYKKAADSGNVFLKNANDLLEAGNYNVDWTFNYTPNVDEWRASLVAAMNKYDAGGSWDDVKTAFVQGWAAQYKAANK